MTVGDFAKTTCPTDATLVFCDPPYNLKKVYGGVFEANKPFELYVIDLVQWSTAPWTIICAPLPTMREWLPRIPEPTRMLWWCKTFAQIRVNGTWQHAVTPLLVYQKEGAPWHMPRGIIPDYIVCGSSMTDIRVTKHIFRGVHPGVTGTPIATEVILPTTKPGDLVVDPMCGIGSILVAAQRLNRRTWGCEIVPEYAEAATRWLRMAQCEDGATDGSSLS